MAHGNFVSYYRVSTDKQGRSGLGLEAQKIAVHQYLNGGHWSLVAEFTEVESGKRDDRPQLEAAMRHCRLTGATLVIAKLDRLSRNAAFLLSLRDSDIEFVAADMPEANRMTVGILAVVAEHEREQISARTKAALGAAKARGVKLGGHAPRDASGMAAMRAAGAAKARAVADHRAADLAPVLAELKAAGMSLDRMAQELTKRGITTPRGGKWTATAVRRAQVRIAP